MDIQKIGMIDYETFLVTMNKSIFLKNIHLKTEDNWEWENKAIE